MLRVEVEDGKSAKVLIVVAVCAFLIIGGGMALDTWKKVELAKVEACRG